MASAATSGGGGGGGESRSFAIGRGRDGRNDRRPRGDDDPDGALKAFRGAAETTELSVPNEMELRITVPLDETNAWLRGPLKPTQEAEVFGCPLAPNYDYNLRPGTSFAIWSYHGCRIRLSGPLQWQLTAAYRAPSSNYRAIVEYHSVVQKAREAAMELAKSRPADAPPTSSGLASSDVLRDVRSCSVGPRVLVCGAASSGRHSVARTLANYAVRHPAGWAPTMLDLDPHNQMFGPPCTVGVAPWDYCSTIDEDLLHHNAALFWAGSHHVVGCAPDGEPLSACGPVSALLTEASTAAIRLATERLVAHAQTPVGWSGSITVAPAFPDAVHGSRFLAHLINTAVVTHVLVVGDPELHAALLTRFDATLSPALPKDAGVYITSQGTQFSVDFISASGGAVSGNLSGVEAKLRNARLRTYFKGIEPRLSLVPYRLELPFAFVDVAQLVEVDGQAVARRIPEGKFSRVAEKRVAALYRSRDAAQRAPMLYPCHVDAVETTSIAVTLCGMLHRSPTERFTLLVGSVQWRE